MNKVYRLVWSATQRAWVVAGELTRAHKKMARVCSAVALTGVMLSATSASADTISVGAGQYPYIVSADNVGTIGVGDLNGSAGYVFQVQEGSAASENQVTVNNGIEISGGNGYSNNTGEEGNGGVGISGSTLTITNNGVLNGGRGADGDSNSGGNGGDGISGTSLVINNTDTINGGDGGYGANVNLRGAGIGGDAISGNALTITNTGTLQGGIGGDGYGPGVAGAGGAGIAGSGLMVTNNGTISGGTAGYADDLGGRGGDGISGDTGTITNNATLSGGVGGESSTVGSTGGNGISGSDLTIVNNSNGTLVGGTGGDSFNVSGGAGGAGIIGNSLMVTNDGTIRGGDSGAGITNDSSITGGDGITGNDLKITNSGTISGGAGFANDNGGNGISGNGLLITNDSTGVITGGSGNPGGYGGNGISGNNLTIINSGTIRVGSGIPAITTAALELSGGTNSLILNTGSNITGDIGMASGDSSTSTTLAIISNDTDKKAIAGNLLAGAYSDLALSGQQVEFTGDATLGDNASLTLSDDGSLKTKAITLGNDVSLITNITDWNQKDIALVETTDTNGITGIFNTDQAQVAGMSAPDFAYVNESADQMLIQYSLRWNELNADAGGTFTLNSGSTFNLGVALADNTVQTNPGWDGKSLTKAGDGTLILSAQNTYTGSTTVSGGTLKTATADAFANTSGVAVSDGAVLNLGGNNQTVTALNNGGTLLLDDAGVIPASPLNVTLTGDVTNSGNIVLNNCSTCAGNTLTVDGDYVGNGGALSLGSVLGGDSSLADKLVVTGNASGTTYVSVANENGTGAQTLEGIDVIDTGSSTAGAFVQRGRIVAGSYDYHLQQGSASGQNANNWYLTSVVPTDPGKPVDPITPPQTPVDPGTPPVIPIPPVTPVGPGTPLVHINRPESGSYASNMAAANTLFTTRMSDRQGDNGYTDPVTGERLQTSLWLRTVGGHSGSSLSDGQSKNTANRFVMQMGGDLLQGSTGDKDHYQLGVMGGYGKQDSQTYNSLSGYRSRGEVSGYSTGLYGTWYQNAKEKTGLYVDSWMLYNWFDNTVKGDALAGESYNSNGVTGSVESGYTFHTGSYRTDGGMENNIYVRPQAQVTWSGVKADDHTEANGTRVEGLGDNNVQTRLGVRLFMNGKSRLDHDTVREFEPFVEANWIYNAKQYGVRMGDTSTYISGARNVGELKTGVEGRLSKNLSLWGSVAQQMGDKGYNDTQGVLGVKYQFK